MSLRPSPDNQFLTRPPGRVFAAAPPSQQPVSCDYEALKGVAGPPPAAPRTSWSGIMFLPQSPYSC